MGKQEIKQNKYHVWKADPSGNPIEHTDRILVGPSKRWILNHLATEEGIELKINNGTIVRLLNGNFWCAKKI